ncbi:porin family protein [Jiulongibacter sediminis]|uniref:Outer membrane protein beta-barrel domain-containing protein n=1 Tax=Jiulongibacter sediminis TaxID=1605367 RepID=A0A0P7BQJ5_9BACT|nr:porin family protein [Jiulongibacter sediminis]KPM47466.1 hypothetical protein AFM12_13215 [Jiulongibacter sediminis]TBX23261.1 hypothetical protein TK44_13225 [Jiulongibacter sediminis]
MRFLLIACCLIGFFPVFSQHMVPDTSKGLPAIPVEINEEDAAYNERELQFQWGVRGGFSKTQINTPGGNVTRVSANGTPLINNGVIVRDELISNSAFGNGFQGAAFIRFIRGSFYLQPEFIYATKGGRFDFIDRSGNLLNRVDARFSAIDVPVLLGIRFRDARVFGGPVVSTALKQNKALQEALKPYTVPDFNFNYFNRPVINSVFGLGFEFKSFFFDLRYEGGIANIAETEIGPANTPKEFFFSTDQFILSLGFIK